jgi:hypothetical protein
VCAEEFELQKDKDLEHGNEDCHEDVVTDPRAR